MSQVKKEEIHQAILASAFECFTARGYTGTTIPMIARGAGISPPNVYSYFPSKLHVLYAIYEPWMRARFAELEQVLLEFGEARPHPRLVDGVQHMQLRGALA
jgi:AcrR family transcriptional regulator